MLIRIASCATLALGLLVTAGASRAEVDDRGATASQGSATWLRAAVHMAPRIQLGRPGPPRLVEPRKFEVGHVLSPTMPQSPFSAPYTLVPTGSQSLAGHVFNGDLLGGDIGQQGTQLDAIGHFGWRSAPGQVPQYYGGLQQDEVVGPQGLLRLGMETAEPLITTMVLLDAAAHIGNGQALPPGYPISRAQLQAMLHAQGLHHRGILAGDVVFIHTGWGEKWYADPANYYREGPGLAHDAAVWLAEQGIALVGLDNPFTDAAAEVPGTGPVPPPETWADPEGWIPFGVHHHNLTQAGVLQIQNLYLGELARERIHLGAVFILPIRIQGGGGSPVRPVVIGHPAS
jgi:kynurenine formamidase